MNQINFQFHEVSCTLKHRTILKQHLLSVFKKYGRTVDHVQYIFCADDYLLAINRSSLQHDYYTDIITFDLSEGEAIVSEIYISIDRVRENAKDYTVSFADELLRVIGHGALHLCGFKDKKHADIKNMRLAEDHFLKSFQRKVSRVTVSN